MAITCSQEITSFQEMKEYEESVWNSLDQNKVSQCAKFINQNIEKSDKELIIQRINKFGRYWPTEHGFHLFGGGMMFRNWLRNNNYGEEYFQIENLDYIYVHLIEIALIGKVI